VTKLKSKTSASDSLLVVDAGGSKTAAWLVDASQAGRNGVLGRGRASAGNPLSMGMAESTRAILEAITAACNDAGQSGARPPRAMLSIAGAANPRLRDHFMDWAQSEKLAKRIAIVPDVLPVLAAGTPDCRGIAVISGTGTVALARPAKGEMTLVGGWGYLLGDEGSGYSIGREALRHALFCMESNSQPGQLVKAVLEKTSVQSVRELTKAMYEQPFPRTAIAAIAPVVLSASEAGDADALAILDSAAAELARLVVRAVGFLNADEEVVTLAASGGMLVSSKRLQDGLKSELKRLGRSIAINIVDEPLEGCVRLADAEFSGSLVAWQ
jgi:N-acetylglucosamine kinase-like BadF-type ATPase